MEEEIPAIDPQNNKMRTLYILFAVIVALWVASYFVIKCYFRSPTDSGSFGDTFGAINALFSGLAFCGIIYTILLQKEELRLQRAELASTREELKRSADAQEKTERQMERQANNLKASATLSALTTLAAYYANEAVTQPINGNMGEIHEYRRKKVLYYERIEEILNDKEGPLNEY